MTIRKNLAIAVLVSLVLTGVLSTMLLSHSTTGSYDPWADVSGPTQGVPDGTINMRDINYLIQRFNSFGTPIDRSSVNSTGGIGAPDFDSGWISISDKAGQYFNVTHNLNDTELMIDITGKAAEDGGVHKRFLGGAGIVSTTATNFAYGGVGTEDASGLVQTDDGGYLIAGYTNSFGAGGFDFWLVRINSAGEMLWNKTYGGTADDIAYSLVEAADGGFVLAGMTKSFGSGDADFWLVKTDSSGNMEWNKTYGGNNFDLAVTVVRTADNGYALAGRSSSFGNGTYEAWLVKVDSVGEMEWNRTYGGTGNDWANCVVQTSDGGYAVFGNTFSYGAGSSDFWLIKTDSEGTAQWNRTYGGFDYEDAGVDCSIIQVSDGGYVMAGQTYTYSVSMGDFWMVKTDASGNMQWNYSYGASGNDMAMSVVHTSDGGYALSGYMHTSAGDGAFRLVRTDANGIMLWDKAYGGTNDDAGFTLIQTADGGYAMAGWTTSYGSGGLDTFLVKTDAGGIQQGTTIGFEYGLAWMDSTANQVTLYRGFKDASWNYVRVRIWKTT